MESATSTQAQLSYWIDSDETIVRVAGPWNAWLKQDTEVPDRCRDPRVLGKNLFSFIGGDGVSHVFRSMHQRVLKTGGPIEFPFRCDSPSFRRWMRMRISRDGDTLRYDSVIIGETGRPRPLPWPTHAADTLVAMCSFCKSYRFPTDSSHWKDLELLFTEPDLPELFSISHGLCQTCADFWLLEA